MGALDSFTHVSPCKENWDDMDGDDWVRHCRLCDQRVYNISALTRTEAERLLARHEGRICTKFYRRPDGTILTQKCPSSVRKVWGTALRWVAAIGFAAPAFAQEWLWTDPSSAEFERSRHQGDGALFSGTTVDQTGTRIPGAAGTQWPTSAELVNVESKETHRLDVDQRGYFSIEVTPGRYQLNVQISGFKSYSSGDLDLQRGTKLVATITMVIGSVGGNA